MRHQRPAAHGRVGKLESTGERVTGRTRKFEAAGRHGQAPSGRHQTRCNSATVPGHRRRRVTRPRAWPMAAASVSSRPGSASARRWRTGVRSTTRRHAASTRPRSNTPGRSRHRPSCIDRPDPPRRHVGENLCRERLMHVPDVISANLRRYRAGSRGRARAGTRAVFADAEHPIAGVVQQLGRLPGLDAWWINCDSEISLTQ